MDYTRLVERRASAERAFSSDDASSRNRSVFSCVDEMRLLHARDSRASRRGTGPEQDARFAEKIDDDERDVRAEGGGGH